MMSEKVPKFRMSRLNKNNMKTFPSLGCLKIDKKQYLLNFFVNSIREM